MGAKIAKIKQTKPSPRYAAEDLAPRNAAADEAALDVYLERNRDALNASIEKAHAEFERGGYFTLEQVMAAVKAQRLKHRRRKT